MTFKKEKTDSTVTDVMNFPFLTSSNYEQETEDIKSWQIVYLHSNLKVATNDSNSFEEREINEEKYPKFFNFLEVMYRMDPISVASKTLLDNANSLW